MNTLATLSRRELVEAAMRAVRVEGDECGLLSQTIRRVVALRGIMVRRALVAEVVQLLALALAGPDLIADADADVDTLAELGELVLRRSGDHTPMTVELASGALVLLDGAAGALVLGRLEAALPTFLRPRIYARGRIRMLPGDAIDRALLEEVEFQGCGVLDWRTWCKVPEATPAALLLSRALEQGTRFTGDGSSFDVFDPQAGAWIYRDRFRPGALRQIVERDKWAAARDEGSFGRRSYSLFCVSGGDLWRADVPREAFQRVTGACAMVAGGARLLARRDADRLRIHFPPPPWLNRLLCTATPIERAGALVAVQLPAGMGVSVAHVLEALLFCEVRPDDHVG